MRYCKHCNQKREHFQTRHMCADCYKTKRKKQKQVRFNRNKDNPKTCKVCKQKKTVADFYKNGATCKDCNCKRSKAYREANKEKIKIRTKAYRERTRNPLKVYIERIRRLYGVTLEWYSERLELQNGVCAICNNPPKPNKNNTHKLYIDHNHDTGQVRELLCNHCNALIGFALENPAILEKSINYLIKHNQLDSGDYSI